MVLPNDFTETLEKIENYGIVDENQDQIQERLKLALQGLASLEGGQSIDLGMVDWTSKYICKFETAIANEICNLQEGKLKENYNNLFTFASTPENIKNISQIVMKVLKNINPAYAISSIIIYFSLFLLKSGLNVWCNKQMRSLHNN